MAYTYQINRLVNQSGKAIYLSLLNPDSVRNPKSKATKIENNQSANDLIIHISDDSSSAIKYWICDDSENGWTQMQLWEFGNNPLTFKQILEGPSMSSPNTYDVSIKNINNTGDPNVQIRIDSDVATGFIIGEVDMDPDPEFSIHSVEVEGNFHEVKFYVERGAVFSLTPGEAKMIETRPLPVIREEADRHKPGFFPVGLHVSLGRNTSVFTSYYMYLEHFTDPSGHKALHLCYLHDDIKGEALKHPEPIDMASLRYGSIRLHFNHHHHYVPLNEIEEITLLDPLNPEAELQSGSNKPFSIQMISEPAVPPAEHHIPTAGLAITQRGGRGLKHQVYTLGGRVEIPQGKGKDPKGVKGITVILMDKDPKKKDDYLGRSLTNNEGYFEIHWETHIHMDGRKDRHPDLYFEVKRGSQLLLSTKDTPYFNAKAQKELFHLALPSS